MGTYYHCALVHGRVLVWWTDDDGTERQTWLEGNVAKDLVAKIMPDDFEIQLAIRAALAAAHKDAPAVVNNPDGTVYSIAGVVIGPACHAIYPATFVQPRPAGCARGDKCSGAVVTIGALATPSCGLIGCKHNWNTALGGRGTDQVKA